MPTGYLLFRMEADAADLLPVPIDVLLLGVGEEGHIESLVPNNAALPLKNPGLFGVEKCYMVVRCPIYTRKT